MDAKARDMSIDWIKFLSVFLIINSHSDVMYPRFSIIATGGAIGDCLFLFVSGYTLWLNRSELPSFANWYKRRINRIYPTVIVWAMIAGWLGFSDLKCEQILTGGGEFVSYIMLYYVILYVVRKYFFSHLEWVYAFGIIVTLSVYWLWFPYKYEVSNNGLYGITTQFRWLPYFIFMLMGAHVGRIADKIRFNAKSDLIMCITCLVLFYGVQLISKKFVFVAPYQILTLLPLAGIVYYFYKLCNAKVFKRLYECHWMKVVVLTVGGLSLESYLIQYCIISDKLNFLFPFNIPIIMMAILMASYLTRCIARLFLQTFDSKDYDWKAIIKVY